MKKHILFSITIVFLAFITNAQEPQDTTQLEEITIHGNRITTPIKEATNDIQILTSEQIKQLPVQTINELLAFVGGVDIRQRGPFGTQADISLDGGTFEETLILLNGIKLINSQTAHNMLNLPIPLEAIDRIEIIRGAASRIYGINAITGVVNIITKSSEKSFVETNIYAGSGFQNQDPAEGKGMYVGGGVEVTGNVGTEKQQHLFSVGQTMTNGQRYNSAGQQTQLFYLGNVNFNSKHSLQLLGGYNHNSFGANGYYAAPGDINSMEIVETALVSLSSKHQFGKFTLSPRISNRYDEDDYRYIKDKPTIGRSKHYTNALMVEANGSLKIKIGEFGLGWESRFEMINSTNIGTHDRNNHGIYVEYKGVFWNKLYANTGVYVNYNSSFGWQVYPGVDLAYRFLPHWKIIANAGSGQRIPSFTDLYLNQLPGNIGNPLLMPENAWNFGGHIQYATQKITAEIGYFYRDITSFIDWVRDSITQPYSPINYGHMNIHGVFARIQQSFVIKNDHKLGYFIRYNYLQPSQRSLNGKISKYVLESLKHQLMAGVHYSYKFFSLQVTNRWIERELNTPYNVLDARVAFQIKSFQIYADASNLLNSNYIEAGAVPMPTRWFKLGLKYRWK